MRYIQKVANTDFGFPALCNLIANIDFSMTQSSFLVPGEGEESSEVKVGSVEEEGSQCSSGFGSLPRKDRPSLISHGKVPVIDVLSILISVPRCRWGQWTRSHCRCGFGSLPRARGYKRIVNFNSAETKIYPAHKC